MEERLARALRERPAGTTALDALREFIFASLTPDSNKALRKSIVAATRRCNATSGLDTPRSSS